MARCGLELSAGRSRLSGAEECGVIFSRAAPQQSSPPHPTSLANRPAAPQKWSLCLLHVADMDTRWLKRRLGRLGRLGASHRHFKFGTVGSDL